MESSQIDFVSEDTQMNYSLNGVERVVAYISLKGNTFWFISPKNMIEKFTDSSYIATIVHKYHVTDLISFGYTLNKLPVVQGCNYLDLKQMFRKILGKDANEKYSRSQMANELNINVNNYEKTYPKAQGSDTCRLYRAIYMVLHK